eukprot:PhF_6_TR5258/c0_g1_i2/m.7638
MSRCSHEHQSCGCQHSHGEEDRGGDAQGGLGQCLFPYIHTSLVRGINISCPPTSNALKPHAQRTDRSKGSLRSDADAEMIVHIPFHTVVRIRGICIIGEGERRAPNLVRLYTNRSDITFDTARRLDPQQELPLFENGDVITDRSEMLLYPLRAAKFMNVASLTLHFPSNFTNDEDEVTGVYHIGLLGESTERPVTDGVVTAVYEVRPNLADHKNIQDKTSSASIS